MSEYAIRPTVRIITDKNLPNYETPGSAGLDLCANVDEPLKVKYSKVHLVPSGIKIHIGNPQIVGYLHSRSSLAVKGLHIASGVGVIDSDYQGEIKIPVRYLCPEGNLGSWYEIKPGERIAQLVFVKVEQINFLKVDKFDVETERGTGGFGSTDKEKTNESR